MEWVGMPLPKVKNAERGQAFEDRSQETLSLKDFKHLYQLKSIEETETYL